MAVLVVTAGHVQAALIINAFESGGDVLFTGSGTANTQSLTLINTSNISAGVRAKPNMYLMLGVPPSDLSDQFHVISGPNTFGSGGSFFGIAGNGDNFGVGTQYDERSLFLPGNYVSGTQLDGSLTFTGQSFASMGLTPGTYVWEWGISTPNYDTLTLNINSTAVPEPSSLALFGIGACVAGIGAARHRRREKQQDATS